MRHLLWTVFLLTSVSVASAQTASIEPYRDPNLAAVKSVVFPGWGQFGNGDGNKGTGLIVNAVVGLLFASDTLSFWTSGSGADLERALGWLAIGLGAVVGGYDAYRNADRLNRENGYLIDETARTWPGPDQPVRLVLFTRKF